MSRKSYGDGSIFKRGDGRWEATVPDFNGTGRRKSFYGKTKSEARQKRDEALRKVARNEYVEVTKQRTGDYLMSWFEGHASTVDTNTRISYHTYITRHFLPSIGNIPLQKLSTADIQRMINGLLKDKYAPSTIKTAHTILSTALNDAVETEKIAKNPARHVKLPRIEETKHTILSPEEIAHLVRSCREEQDKGKQIGALVLLLLATGLRIGEALALHWSDVDLERATLQVRATLVVDKEMGFIENDPKTKTSTRTVPLAPLVVEALTIHRRMQRERKILTLASSDKGLVFVGPRSHSYWRTTSAFVTFRRFLRKHNLPPMKLHDLRHNVATALLLAGVPMKVVSELLGHSNISTTVNIYGHVAPNMYDDAVQKIDKLFGS